ncbi:MAG TPA: amino acid racemase [Pyrinomonadaceae bacterium]|jgi:aspartate racemase|nr:amino acid racemase [Pyrinomonadaceae bacterium]
MKTLGLIGGTGPESTIDYYRLLTAQYREKMDGASPPVIINSVNLKSMITWMGANELDKVTDYLVKQFETLEKAGVDFAALTANTPHIVFDEIQQRVNLPLISIVEAACERAQKLGVKSVGLFGTRYTMQAPFYPKVFSRTDIRLITPNAEEQEYIHEKYFGELLKDTFLPETRAKFLEIADEMKARDNVEAIILGGTEIPLLLRTEEHNGIQLLDTTRIHVDRLIEEMLT